MERDEAEKLFANNHPCIYKGQIICRNCPRYHETSPGSDDDCDMKEGRNKRMDAFCEGYLAALTVEQRKNCIDIGGGHGLCDMCASGRTDLCRYVNTIGALKEIDGLREKIAALTGSDRPEGSGKYLLTIPVDVDEYTCPENGEKVYTATTEDGVPIMAEEVTGTWRKVEP